MNYYDQCLKTAYRLDNVYLNHCWKPNQICASEDQESDRDAIDEAVTLIKNMANLLKEYEVKAMNQTNN